jgi:hypothetical protein
MWTNTARSSGSETLSRSRSSVGYTIDTHESEFSEATGRQQIFGVPGEENLDLVEALRRSTIKLVASTMFWPCETRTSTCRNFATIS